MSGIPTKNMYKSKFNGCKSTQSLRSVLGGSTICSNDCYEYFWVGKSTQPLRSVLGGSTICSNDCYEYFWVGVSQLCTVR